MASKNIDQRLIPYFPQEVQDRFKEWLRQYGGSANAFGEFYDNGYWGEMYEPQKAELLNKAVGALKFKLDSESSARAQDAADEDMNKRRLARQKTYTSFSGADIVASIRIAGGKPIVFGEIQTISYSIYRPMSPVYTLGRINPKGIVRGPRTIAGSLIFTVFDRHVLKQVMDTYKPTKSVPNSQFYGMDAAAIADLRKYAKTDEMPPFDINISFMNEYGQSATLNIFGIYIMSEGQTMSIEDMITENTMQYIAMDIDLMDYDVDTNESNPLK